MRETYVFQYLDTNGDGTGTDSAVGNYASAAEDFYYEVTGSGVEIHRMIVMVRDTGAFDAADYGNSIALTNGIDVLVYDANEDTERSFVGGKKIKNNIGWGALCFDADVKTWGIGDEFLLVRWTFAKSGAPLRLQKSDKLVVRLNDDFSGLVDQTFQIQGVIK